MSRRLLHIILLLEFTIPLSAQDLLPLNHSFWAQTERIIQLNNLPVFTSFKPLPGDLYLSTLLPDSLRQQTYSPGNHSWLYRKFFHEHLVNLHASDLDFTLDPLLNLSLGRESGSSAMLWRNTRGIIIRGTSGQKLSFSTAFYENQAAFPSWIISRIRERGTIPGQGTAKGYGKNGYDFAWSEGNLSFAPLKNLVFEIGYGKRFFGVGYRSLLLSDYSFVYPYVGFRYTSERFFIAAEDHSYIQLYEPPGGLRGRTRKTATYHFIGYRWDHLELSLMESDMYANPDSTSAFRWQAEIFNPLPFINTIAARGNGLIGLNLKASLLRTIQIYSQILMDEIDWKDPSRWQSIRNKTGIQLGAKWFDAFNLKNLYLQAEFNEVRPYAYTSTNPVLAYTHYNEPLAHPLGANFREYLVRTSYGLGRMELNASCSYARTGSDGIKANWGSDIFLSEYSAENGYPSYTNTILQGIRMNIVNASALFSLIINPAYNLRLSLGYRYRKETSANMNVKTNYVFLSLQTALDNLYDDF